MKTRDRILAASQELFNRRGERSVTTNHIAAHLGISPGNLYYHFPNKAAIIRELYQRHRTKTLEMMLIPEDRPFTMRDKARLMEALFEALWEYQFIYRDLEHMLSEDPALAQLHRESFSVYLNLGMRVHEALANAGLQETTATQQRDLSFNAWIVITNWIVFLRTNILKDHTQELTPALIKRGVYQILSIEKPYMTDKALKEFASLEQEYYCDLDALIEPVDPIELTNVLQKQQA